MTGKRRYVARITLPGLPPVTVRGYGSSKRVALQNAGGALAQHIEAKDFGKIHDAIITVQTEVISNA